MNPILKQNSKGLYKDIQEVGCFFTSCLAVSQMHSGKNLSVEQYNELWDEAHAKGFMKNRSMVKSDKVINLGFEKLGVNKKAFEVGTAVGVSSGSFYGWVAKARTYKRADAFIQKIRQPKGSVYPFHFRVVNKAGKLLFDPYSPTVKSAGSEHIIWYCIKEL